VGRELNSRERVLRLFGREKIDRIPVFSGMGNVTVHGLEKYGWRFADIHVDAHKMATMASSTFQFFGFECAVVPFDMGIEAEALGCEMNYYPHREDIVYPTIFQNLAERVQDLDIRVPSDLAKADLSKTMFKEPDMVHKVLDKTAEVVIELSRIYREAGADYITIREMGAGADILSPSLFASLVRPHLEQVFAAIDSPKVLHICGDTDMIVDQMALCGADAISVEEKNHVAESRKKLGPDIRIFGNIAGFTTLVDGKPDDVDKAVKEAIANGVNAVWPGCDIWPTAPKENMEAMMAAAKKYGKLG